MVGECSIKRARKWFVQNTSHSKRQRHPVADITAVTKRAKS